MPSSASTPNSLAKVFVFSYVWSLGGNLQPQFHAQFDEWASAHFADNMDGLGKVPPADKCHALRLLRGD